MVAAAGSEYERTRPWPGSCFWAVVCAGRINVSALLSARAAITQAQQHADDEDQRHHTERQSYRDVDQVNQQHLGADEQQDHRQAIFEQHEAISKIGQQEVHSPQPHDREDVRGQHDEGIGRDGKDGRYTVNGKDDITDFHQD